MRKPLLLLFVSLLLCTCSEVDEFNGIAIRQYADVILNYSSQYASGNYSANQILGKENVYPDYGDKIKAWASDEPDNQREYLIIGFDTVQTVKIIEIFETYNPGAVDSVSLRNADTQKWNRIYSKPAVTTLPAESRIFSIYIDETTFLVDAIRISLNSPEVAGWNEIDAVAITGQRKQ